VREGAEKHVGWAELDRTKRKVALGEDVAMYENGGRIARFLPHLRSPAAKGSEGRPSGVFVEYDTKGGAKGCEGRGKGMKIGERKGTRGERTGLQRPWTKKQNTGRGLSGAVAESRSRRGVGRGRIVQHLPISPGPNGRK